MNSHLCKNLTRMALAPLRERGLFETARSIRAVLYARRQERACAFDRRYGTDTERRVRLADLQATGPDVPALWRYWPTLERPFRRVMEALEVSPQEFVFVDLGSGKGRVLLYASDLPFVRIVGVELAPTLHCIAERNVRTYRSPRQRCAAFELICADAARWTPPPEDLVVYLFQPFPRATLAAVLDHLIASMVRHPRRVLLAYVNPLFDAMITATGRFERRATGRPTEPGEFPWTIYQGRC